MSLAGDWGRGRAGASEGDASNPDGLLSDLRRRRGGGWGRGGELDCLSAALILNFISETISAPV